ncbi:unnamed protein product [Bursaphelenchus okinawaensis]|uniref:Uncharacterized protein n=1 Tax=Bursaphelenchus okinawaensis TaxID=465554 RepID=A0A811KEC6_9BILA|nr:unnamed protein product [Bursaphelenchus okinawaensis]CAG9103119.1 unnamed protein product [Bursaphelenchus okinawaensis]
MSLGQISYTREAFLALKSQAHEANLPPHMNSPEYMNADGKFVPDKYIEGLWKLEKGSGKKKADLSDAFTNGSSLSPQRRGFSGGCKEVSSNDETSLRRRALNNNLPATSQNSKRTKNGVKGSTSTFGKKFTRKDEKNEEIPEWMDGGPLDHNEIIPLGGFDDEKEKKVKTEKKSYLLNALTKDDAAPKSSSSLLPESDLEFAAQFGLLDIMAISNANKTEAPEAPKQSRLSQFFSEKPKENTQSTLPPAVAMLLKGASNAHSAQKPPMKTQIMDEQTLLDCFKRSENMPNLPKPIEEESWDEEVEELKKLVLSDYAASEPVRKLELETKTPVMKQTSSTAPPVDTNIPQQSMPSAMPGAPPFFPMNPNMMRMTPNGGMMPPMMIPGPNGMPIYHPGYINYVEHMIAVGQIDATNPRVEMMLQQMKYQKQIFGNPPNPFMQPVMPPGSSGERGFVPPSSMSSSTSSPAPAKTKPAFDLVPTAVMLQQTKQQHKEERDNKSPSTITDKSRSGSSTSLNARRSSNPPDSQIPLNSTPTPSMMPPFMGAPPQMGPYGSAGYAQMALQMEAKRLQEAHQRGDSAAVAYLQNSIQTQLQALTCLQNAAAQNMAQGGYPIGHSLHLMQQKAGECPPNYPGPIGGMQPEEPPRNSGGLPSVFQKLSQLHDQQRNVPSNLSILNKLPPNVQPLTVEELEKQLASS